MIPDWIVGNKPNKEGFYWVTVTNGYGKGNPNKTYPEVLTYKNGDWYCSLDRRFYTDNIVAYMRCNIPAPYDPVVIGDAKSFYIKVVSHIDGSIRYYSKQLHSIKWSRIGYDTKEKAINAMRRLKRLELEETNGGSKKDIYVVVDGNGNEV